jgi:hypothetical protein
MMGVCPNTNYIFVVEKKYMEKGVRERERKKMGKPLMEKILTEDH